MERPAVFAGVAGFCRLVHAALDVVVAGLDCRRGDQRLHSNSAPSFFSRRAKEPPGLVVCLERKRQLAGVLREPSAGAVSKRQGVETNVQIGALFRKRMGDNYGVYDA
jgi:hypothetical protein